MRVAVPETRKSDPLKPARGLAARLLPGFARDFKPDGNVFVISTEQDKTKEKLQYKTRSVILAIGNRGTPMRLRVSGEELKIKVAPTEPVLPAFCRTDPRGMKGPRGTTAVSS